jgi:hypothetical protein
MRLNLFIILYKMINVIILFNFFILYSHVLMHVIMKVKYDCINASILY